MNRLHSRPALLVIALGALAAGLYFTFGADALAALLSLGASPSLVLAAGAGGLVFRSDETPTEMVERMLGDIHNMVDTRLSKVEAEVGLELKRRNRPGAFGPDDSGVVTAEQRKSLDLAARALIRGDEAEAKQHFREAKAMYAGNDPSGGYLVMPAVSDEMTQVMLEISPLLEAVRIVDLEASDEFEEIVDRDEAGVVWVGEATDRSDTDSPELGKFVVPLHEIYAMPSVSQKLIDSARIDVMAWLEEKLAEKFASSFNAAIVSGNGAARPLGFLSVPVSTAADSTRAWGTLQYVPTGTSGGFGPTATASDCLDDLIASLKPQYRKGASWVMSRTTAATVRKLKDTTGLPLWQPSMAAGQPMMLKGFPVIEDDFMPAVGANSFSIAFGNLKKSYTLVRRLGLRFLVDPYTAKPRVRLYCYQRVGGGVSNSEALKLLKFGTS
jgi:HK97 family phage major capsid protein